MAFEFPASPTIGDEVIGPNGAVYRWDGEKWIGLGGAGGGDDARIRLIEQALRELQYISFTGNPTYPMPP